eukprot:583563-Rhodomonas_salina.1
MSKREEAALPQRTSAWASVCDRGLGSTPRCSGWIRLDQAEGEEGPSCKHPEDHTNRKKKK